MQFAAVLSAVMRAAPLFMFIPACFYIAVPLFMSILTCFYIAAPLFTLIPDCFYSSSRNTRDFSREIRAQSEIWLHREYNLAMKNKSLSYTMLHWSIVTHA